MPATELDHVIYVADATGLDATVARLGSQLGVEPVAGGVHTTFGTCNALLPLAGLQYLEVVAVHDPGTAAGSPFGSAVAALSARGGGWLGWAVRVEDPEPVAHRLARQVIPGGRRRPDGVELAWRQVGTDVLTGDPVLPFFLTWDVPPALHPAAHGPDDVRIVSIRLDGALGGRQRLAAWLDLAPDGAAPHGDAPDSVGRVGIEWAEPRAATGVAGVAGVAGAAGLAGVPDAAGVAGLAGVVVDTASGPVVLT